MTAACSRPAAFVRLVALCFGLLVCALVASAQDALSACGPETRDFPDSHAWVIIKDHPSRPGRGRAVLVHIAPRTGELPAEIGSAQLARTLDQYPLAVGAWGERVYLAFNGVDDNRQAVVRVRSVRAMRQGFGWVFEPSDRFTPHPALRHTGGVASIAAGDNTIVLVVTTAEGRFEVFALVRNDWLPVTLPALGPDARVEAWPTPGGVSIGVIEDGVLSAHELSLESDQAILGEPRRLGQIPATATLCTVGAAAFATERAEESLSAFCIDGDRPTQVARLDMPAEARFAPVSARGPRLFALWWEDPHRADGAPSLPTLRTVEVSLGSGAVLYEGPLPTSKFISADEFRMLAMLLMAVVIGVLIIVLRSDSDEEAVPLPPGFALAEPSRRVVATGIDFVIAAWIVSISYGVGFWDLVSLKLLFMSDGAWTAIPATFVVGGVIGTLSEWLSGRSVGKLLTGMRVIAVGTGATESRRVPLMKSLARNTVKWFFPPVAALAAIDSQGRHRGDRMAGVIVAIKIDPEGPET